MNENDQDNQTTIGGHVMYWLMPVTLVAILVFALCMPRPLSPSHPVVVMSGQHAGREGNVVGESWFWLRLCVNVTANEEETQKKIQAALDRNVGWKMPSEAHHQGEDVVAMHRHGRAWIGVWRWQVQVHDVYK